MTKDNTNIIPVHDANSDSDSEDDMDNSVVVEVEPQNANTAPAVTVEREEEEEEMGENETTATTATKVTLTAEEEKAEMEAVFDPSAKLVAGSLWFCIPTKWWKSWLEYSKFKDSRTTTSYSLLSVDSEGNSKRPGVIDMSAVTEVDPELKGKDTVIIKKNAMETYDFMRIPQAAWDKVVAWYGVAGHPYAVRVVDPNEYSNSYRFDTKIRLLLLLPDEKKPAAVIYVAKSATIGEVKELACAALDMHPENIKDSVRLVDMYAGTRGSVLSDEKTVRKTYLLERNPVLVEQMKDGKWPEVPAQKKALTTSNYGYSSSSSYTNTYTTYTPYKPPKMEKGGVCGLQNLGNTCFMNSALQCLSHTEALRNYLLSGAWKKEVNTVNVLGTHGKLTAAYAKVVHDIWEGDASYFSPAQFKASISQVASQFAGYQQHDSQELLGYLLDGIHEDLNRIKKKPYVENPDYAGQSDKAWAAESWARYKLRNDSVIVDWFQGQIKSLLVCPECQTESVVFDPFMCLSVPLPQKNAVRLSFMLHTCDMRQQHVHITLDMKATLSVLELCRKVESLPKLAAVDPPVRWNQICIASSWYGVPETTYNGKSSIADLEDKDLDLFVLTGVKGARDLFVVTAELGTGPYGYRKDHFFGQPFLLPYTKDMCYFDLWLTALRGIANAIDPAALKEFVSSAAQPQAEAEDDGDDNNDDGGKSDPVWGPDDRDWGEDIIAGVSNKALLKVADKIFAVVVIDKNGYDDRDVDLRKGTGNERAAEYKVWKYLSYLKLLWTKEALAAGVYSEDMLLKAQTDCDLCPKAADGSKGGVITLERCLDLFTSPETLDDEDLWRCSHCKELRKASKKTDFWRLPPLLIVHLKRFSSHSGRMRDKLTDFVDFPLEGLDMTKRVLSNETGEDLIYDLYAVSNHFGSLGGGHYTAYAQVDGEWYNFDDARVTKVARPDDVKTDNAYVLFYRLRGWKTPTFQKVADAPEPVDTIALAPAKKEPLLAITDGKETAPKVPRFFDGSSDDDDDELQQQQQQEKKYKKHHSNNNDSSASNDYNQQQQQQQQGQQDSDDDSDNTFMQD